MELYELHLLTVLLCFLCSKIVIRLSKLIGLDHEFKFFDFSEYYCSIVAIFSLKTALKWYLLLLTEIAFYPSFWLLPVE
jgi:hypothetical protein